MSNVFKRFTEVVNKPNRASYDLSFQNNLTMKFGKLYPVFCKEVLPGDSFKIQPTFNFNFMPLVSPIQTRMKATLHFFYVRNRPQWKDFMDWDGMTKEGLTPPYIKLTKQNRDMINTGEIGDFFGIPSKIYGNVYSVDYEMHENEASNPSYGTGVAPGVSLVDGNYTSLENYIYTITSPKYDNLSLGQDIYDVYSNMARPTSLPSQNNPNWTVVNAFADALELKVSSKLRIKFGNWWNDPSLGKVCIYDNSGSCVFVSSEFEIPAGSLDNFMLEFDIDTSEWEIDDSMNRRPDFLVTFIRKNDLNWYNSLRPLFQFGRLVSNAYDVADKELSELPWASDGNPNGLRLNAFPFRAYEAIYNSFYRDERNNPRIVNGQPEYNKYITTDEGGADTTHYKLYQRNWEPDYLTTAVQSPQQGVAPLVGITSVSATGTIEITDGNGDTYTAQAKIAEDGDTIQGINVLSENSPTAVNRALVDLASTGISISDLRNVNALQRWLEINMRRGLRYRDQVKSHYGVDIEFKELQMPEFIGGVNEDVIVNRISQTVETDENPLGSLAGQAGVLGTSKHKISHYCDEKGFIIGIFSIAPVPNYSQNLPKHMIKTSQLDYFTPEFAHIGMQPILNSEVTPLQANLEGKLNDVFGYQRPWYEYLASTDEVHGQFRDTMRRYLINRVYDGTPELGSEFLTINPDTINDVFAVTEDTDKIYGQIWFDVTAKRPIASNVTPRIEP